MPCFHPIPAAQPTDGGPLIFPRPEHFYLLGDYKTLEIPCGKCHGCMLTRSRHWAIRCVHEAQMHKHNCFVTLTYNNKHLPADLSLHHEHFTNFLRSIRRRLRLKNNTDAGPTALATTYADAPAPDDLPVGRGAGANYNIKDILRTWRAIKKHNGTPVLSTIRYFMCGEYGPVNGRPHYHALLFNLDFNDRLFLKTSPAGEPIYTSRALTELWPYGYSSIGDVTFRSAAYVSRYIMSKRYDGDEKYTIINPDTGEIHYKTKEYNQMSRQAGLGSSWYKKYHADVTTRGKVLERGHESNPPRYYDKLQKKLDKYKLEELKWQREKEASNFAAHHTPERLAVQEQVSLAKTKRLQRSI